MDAPAENLSTPPVTRTHRYASILKYPNFLKLWGAQVCAKFAENIFNFSLIILIFQLTDSVFIVSVLIVLISIPPIILSAIAGVVADSVNRKTVLVLSNLFRALLVIVAIAFHEQAPLLLGVAFLLSVAAQFFSPAEVSSIPTLVDKEHLFAANALYQFTGYATFLLGYTIAGPLLARWGTVPLFLCVLGLYGMATLLASLLPRLTGHLHSTEPDTTRISPLFQFREFWHRLKDGFRFVATHRVVRFVIIQIAIVFSIERGFLSLAPSFATDFLKFNLDDISLYLILPTGLGALAGVLTANALKRHHSKSRLITIGLLLDAAAMVALGFWIDIFGVIQSHNAGLSVEMVAPWLVSALAFVSGFADPMIIVSAQTALQERTRPEDRGRVFGSLYTFMNLLGLIPALAIGAVSSFISINVVVTALGLIILATAIWGIFFYRRYDLAAE